ncbi:MAG: dTMP kinase [candidate division Zixibacteria bacterium]|nr:dTMP kinase [candidate division Zixibacteria bacterium]
MAHKTDRPFFITFEGIDGCGKTTQLEKAYDYLTASGLTVYKLREPGSTGVAEKIREILLGKNTISDITELLLYEAARADLVDTEIKPLLENGHILLCDRFYDSTTAYQGYGRKLDIAMVKNLHRVAVGDLTPDLTFLFDLDLKTALTRRGQNPDRLESQPEAFFERVRQGFLAIARVESDRVKVIDASRSIEAIFEDVKEQLTQLLGLK